MDMGTVRGIATGLAILSFLSVWVWAWSGKRRATFEHAARLPLEEHGSTPPAHGASQTEATEERR